MCIQFFSISYVFRLDRNRRANSFCNSIQIRSTTSVNRIKKKEPFLRSPAGDDLTAIRRIFKSSCEVFILASRRHNIVLRLRHAY